MTINIFNLLYTFDIKVFFALVIYREKNGYSTIGQLSYIFSCNI